MKPRLFTIAILIAAGFCSRAIAQECLKYDTTVVSLTGTLRARVFAGPPNYESTKRGDRKETALILVLVARICTSSSEAKGGDVSESNVRDVQLVVVKPAHWKTIQRRMGKRVAVTGTLFHANTGHHRTKVLLDVATIRAAT